MTDDLVLTARQSVERGLNHATTGNASARAADGFWITPSGFALDLIEESQLVRLSLEGKTLGGFHAPSSEWRMHRDIYCARPRVGAILHVHPPFATTLACLRMELPAVHYMIAATGAHSVRCAAYATYGTEALSRAVLVALGESDACLLANHGLITVADGAGDALHRAEEVEAVAGYYLRGLAVGRPTVLDEREMDAVMRQIRPPVEPV